MAEVINLLSDVESEVEFLGYNLEEDNCSTDTIEVPLHCQCISSDNELDEDFKEDDPELDTDNLITTSYRHYHTNPNCMDCKLYVDTEETDDDDCLELPSYMGVITETLPFNLPPLEPYEDWSNYDFN